MHHRLDHERVVRVVLTHSESKLPKYANPGDAGADVYAVPNEMTSSRVGKKELDENGNLVTIEAGDYLIYPGETVPIDLGLKIQVSDGWEIQVRSRSGLAARGLVVANSPGTIDSGYRGQCRVLLRNNNATKRVIKPGTRVAQFVLQRAPQAIFHPVDTLDESSRGAGGFGSTGTK